LSANDVDGCLAEATVVHTLLEVKESVLAVALLDSELYILCNGRTDNQIDVYATTPDYALRRRLTVPRLGRYDAQDMASSQPNSFLYIADSGGRCIHRLPPTGGTVTRWRVPREPCGLSVTPTGGLLVVCGGERALLLEMGVVDGRLRMRQVELQADIVGACQAIQLSTGQFAIRLRGEPGLCVVDADGQLTRSYVGSASLTKLRCPSHVTRGNGRIFVADDHRVVVLSWSLEFVRDVIPVALPSSLCLDQVTGRLYVGHGRGVTFVQL